MEESEIKKQLAKLSPGQLKELTRKDANLNLRVRQSDKDSMSNQAEAENISLADYLVNLNLDHMKQLED